jgi:hypothetical protein
MTKCPVHGCHCRPIECIALHPCITSILQLAGLYLLGVVVVLCAYAGYTVTASILEVGTLSSPCMPSTTRVRSPMPVVTSVTLSCSSAICVAEWGLYMP